MEEDTESEAGFEGVSLCACVVTRTTTFRGGGGCSGWQAAGSRVGVGGGGGIRSSQSIYVVDSSQRNVYANAHLFPVVALKIQYARLNPLPTALVL